MADLESTEIKLEAFKKAFIYLMWKMRIKRRIIHYLTRKFILRDESEKFENVLKELHQNVPVIDRPCSTRIEKDVDEVREMLPRYLDFQISQAIGRDYKLMATYLIGDKNDQPYQTEDITPLIRSFLKVYRSIRVDYFFFK